MIDFFAQLAQPMDVICLGRAGMDLYALEDNTDFAEVSGFRKHVGGSPANIAIGLSRLGMSAGFIGKVSDDAVGRYVKAELEAQGVDTRGLSIDASGTRTSLALTEMRASQCEVVIYRNNAADLALSVSDVTAEYLGAAKALLVSGTALCIEPSRSATLHAMSVAREQGSRVILDLDYRAYIWASEAEAAEVCRQAAVMADILIGNREEFAVLGAELSRHDQAATASSIAQSCFGAVTRCVVVKDGERGCSACFADGTVLDQGIFRVPVRKPFGAGDAFAAALLAGLVESRGWPAALRDGAASAAMVVAGPACGESTPTRDELEQFVLEVAPS